MDDVRTYVECVVLAHKSRRNVDRYNGGGRCVDVFHYGSETSGERFVESGAEQTVNHHVGLGERRRSELACHLVEVNLVHQLHKLLVGLTVLGEHTLSC